MLFNSALIGEVRRENSFRLADFAKLLDISEPYLSMLEKGIREPSLELIQKLVAVTEIPIGRWLSVNPPPESEEISCLMRSDALAAANMKSRLNREHLEHLRAEERAWELENVNEHFKAEIRLRERFEDVVCAETLSKNEKLKKLKELAVWTMEEGELKFNEILRVLRIERFVLRKWLDTDKRAYECRFVDGGEILASSPGEAALCLQCFECKAFESGECLGYGDEKLPENIGEILERLKANGVYEGKEQAKILEKHYGLSLSPREIASIRYRTKKNLPVPDEVFFLDVRNKR